MKQKIIDKVTLKFILVGIINTLVGTGTMFLLYNLCGVGDFYSFKLFWAKIFCF